MMDGLFLVGSDLARLFDTTPQQISRWKADGFFPFHEGGAANAVDCFRAIVKGNGDRKGRMPEVVKIWQDLKAAGCASAEYLDGYENGMAAVAAVLYPLLCQHEPEKAAAWWAADRAEFEVWSAKMDKIIENEAAQESMEGNGTAGGP